MKRPLVLLTLGLAAPALATLAGCDTVHGLSSRAPLSAPLDVPCISAALSSVEEVVVVIQGDYTSAGRQESSRHARTPKGTAYWVYRFGGPQTATLQILFDDRGRGSYSNSLLRLNARVPREDMQVFEPVMNRINSAVQDRCGLRSDLKISRR